MKRLPITPQERKFLQDIENTATLFMLMFKVYPTPINADALAFDMKWDLRKARRKLDDLSSDGFTALMKGQGYVLTAIARNMVVEFFGNVLQLEAQALAPAIQAQAQQALAEDAGVIAVRALEAENSSTHTACALVVEEDILTLNINLESSTTTSSTQNVCVDETFPTVKQILAASPILFAEFDGKEVSLKNLNLAAIDPEEALAVMAHCYSQRMTNKNPRGLYAPSGMVHRMLEQGDKARREFRNAPLEYLPDDYLEALELIDFACDVCGTSFKSRAKLAEHESMLYVCQHECGKRYHSKDELIAHHHEHAEEEIRNAPLICNPLDPQSRGARAWEMLKEMLKGEMPRAGFDTWVRDTQPVEYEGSVLTIAVRNAYARDWLESRLESTVNRMLASIMNQSMTVRFVVAQVEDMENSDE